MTVYVVQHPRHCSRTFTKRSKKNRFDLFLHGMRLEPADITQMAERTVAV